jgi:FkbM family methyltransferase
MQAFVGPRLYYSLFGVRGLALGAKARLLQVPIEVAVRVPGILHPVHLRLRTTDVPLCREVLLNAQYDWEVPVSPSVIVDAGANIGLASVFYANKYPAAKIIAVEPEPLNFEVLLKNTNYYSNIIPVHAALWSENEDLSIFDSGSGETAFQIRTWDKTTQRGSRRRVSGLTLTKLMKEFDLDYIDLLKVDIEGSEKEVFEHSSSWIGRVGIIAIELHDWLRSGCSLSVQTGAKGFEMAGQKGETTYFIRQRRISDPPSHTENHTNSQNEVIRDIHSKLPLKILSVI